MGVCLCFVDMALKGIGGLPVAYLYLLRWTKLHISIYLPSQNNAGKSVCVCKITLKRHECDLTHTNTQNGVYMQYTTGEKLYMCECT